MLLSAFIISSFMLLTGYCGLLIYFRRGFDRLKRESGKNQPFVSIIVPAHNEEKSLPDLLHCLSRLTYPKNKREIILVNDRSADRTWEIMQTFSQKEENVHALPIREKPEGISPKKQALLKGIETAKGEIIITTDADTLPGSGWIDSMVARYTEGTGMVLGYAPYRTDGPFMTFFHKLLALDYFAMGAIAAATAGMKHPTTCNGANFSYRKKVFEEVGGFGKTIRQISGDDDLFMQRVHAKKKWEITFSLSPESAVFTDPPDNVMAFVRQRIRFSSKHLAYPIRMIAVLSGVYLFHLSMIAMLIGSFFSFSLLSVFGILLLMKGTVDIWFLKKGQQLLEKRNLLKYYPAIAIPHLFYVVIFPVLGQIMPKRW